MHRREAGKLLGLQALRGLAALLVVAHHTAGTLARAKYGGHELAGGLLFPLGRAGVDLFFVLSGFVIYYVHGTDIGRPSRFVRYAVRRLTRIYPTFWVALALVGIAVFIVHPSQEAGGEPSFAVVLQSALLIPFTAPEQTNVVDVAWTLSHEILFYMLFGLLILSRRVGGVVLIAWFGALLGARLFAALPPPLNFLLHVKNLEFFMGMGIARLLLYHQFRRGWAMVVAGVALFLATAFVELLGGYDFLTALPTLGYGAGAAAVIFGLSSLEERPRGFYIPPSLVFLGSASYSIYLIHFTIVVALVKAAHHLGLTGRLEVLPLFLAIATTATLGGAAMYVVAERRLMDVAHRLIMGRATMSSRSAKAGEVRDLHVVPASRGAPPWRIEATHDRRRVVATHRRARRNPP